jgi:hypothetical protein
MADPVVKTINGPIYLSPFQKIVGFNLGGVTTYYAYYLNPSMQFFGVLLSDGGNTKKILTPPNKMPAPGFVFQDKKTFIGISFPPSMGGGVDLAFVSDLAVIHEEHYGVSGGVVLTDSDQVSLIKPYQLGGIGDYIAETWNLTFDPPNVSLLDFSSFLMLEALLASIGLSYWVAIPGASPYGSTYYIPVDTEKSPGGMNISQGVEDDDPMMFKAIWAWVDAEYSILVEGEPTTVFSLKSRLVIFAFHNVAWRIVHDETLTVYDAQECNFVAGTFVEGAEAWFDGANPYSSSQMRQTMDGNEAHVTSRSRMESGGYGNNNRLYEKIYVNGTFVFEAAPDAMIKIVFFSSEPGMLNLVFEERGATTAPYLYRNGSLYALVATAFGADLWGLTQSRNYLVRYVRSGETDFHSVEVYVPGGAKIATLNEVSYNESACPPFDIEEPDGFWVLDAVPPTKGFLYKINADHSLELKRTIELKPVLTIGGDDYYTLGTTFVPLSATPASAVMP